ncbi:MAG: 3'-5' exonuclease [Campylobacterales bacterium]|nr:3'-5' exonuclease [Campylobacterales bacterium]
MPKLLFVDVETTGLEEKDRICELALIVQDAAETTVASSLCKSPKKIGTAAMAVHHITNECIKDALPCAKTAVYALLEEQNTQENVLIGHNVRFDLSMLEKEGFAVRLKIVDTLRCVKALIPECEQFGLQFLRYELGLYKDEAVAHELGITLSSHRALSDAWHLKLLYEHLLDYACLEELIKISSKPVLLQKLPFGKYAGRYIEEISEKDPAYLHWMMGNIEDMDEDLSYSIGRYLGLDG